MFEQSTVTNEASVDVNGWGLKTGEDAEGVVADVSSEKLREAGERSSESGGHEVLPPEFLSCLLYTSPSPRDQRGSRMPSSA